MESTRSATTSSTYVFLRDLAGGNRSARHLEVERHLQPGCDIAYGA